MVEDLFLVELKEKLVKEFEEHFERDAAAIRKSIEKKFEKDAALSWRGALKKRYAEVQEKQAAALKTAIERELSERFGSDEDGASAETGDK